MFIQTDQLEASAQRFAYLVSPLQATATAFQGNLAVESFLAALPDQSDGNSTTEMRKAMLEAVSPEPVDFAFERIIGKNDSVYSNFVDLIEAAKRKVGRVAIKTATTEIGFATGFMVSERMVITNWHVFNEKTDVGESEIQFFYEYDIKGMPEQAVVFKLVPDDFFYSSKELDYCFVAVSQVDVTGGVKLTDVGYLFLDPSIGKLSNDNEEALNIIHHPNGDYKQLSIRENLFVKMTPTTIWYRTDTAPGSSGSPVFNDQWQVVGLHHMGVAKQDGDGQYLDRDGNFIPVINGKIDASKINWIANEGIRISVILADIFSRFPSSPLVNGLRSNPLAYNPAAPINLKNISSKTIKTKETMESNATQQNITINFPASLIEGNGYININIDTRAKQDNSKAVFVKQVETASPALLPSGGEFTEAQKIDKENAMDFSKCGGYLPNFLGQGHLIKLFQPTTKLKKFIARVNNSSSIELKYYYYSVLFHSVRMVPALSAINVNGDLNKRKDRAKRVDNWLRDKRLDLNIQLDDGFYSHSNFDKGHMSRREDADYGDTPEMAKLAADTTCMYTNACPQVPTINRSNEGGLWGKLENIVLEKGAVLEPTKTNKISVFNGPIFLDDDPVFKGIQIPLNFYKLIVWITDKGSLKATAFKLSQENLLGDINFEELDIDKNLEFKEYQISIKSLGDATFLDFSVVMAIDTFDYSTGVDAIPLKQPEEVINHISYHNSVDDI